MVWSPHQGPPVPWLFTIQRIWIVLGRSLFLRSVHTFWWFLKSNWSRDFCHAETGNRAKKRVVLRREISRSKFKVEWENDVWTKIRFLASGFLFTCSNFTLIFTVFSIFWIEFFLNDCSNLFIVRSRSNQTIFVVRQNFWTTVMH